MLLDCIHYLKKKHESWGFIYTVYIYFVVVGNPLFLSYQFGVAPVVQYKVFWFEVSVNDSFGMQVGEGLHHTSRVEPGGWILKWTPGKTGQQSSAVIFVVSNTCSGSVFSRR